MSGRPKKIPVKTGQQKEAQQRINKFNATQKKQDQKYVDNQKVEQAQAEEASRIEEAIKEHPELKWHPTLVPALDALIGEPDLLTPDKDTPRKAEEMIIPYQYIDRLSEFRDDSTTTRGESAEILLATISHMLKEIHYKKLDHFECENGMKIRFSKPDDAQTFVKDDSKKSTSASALATADYLNNAHPGTVAILTGDNAMISKALGRHIDIAEINHVQYTGRRKLRLPRKGWSSWFGKNPKLTEEEFAKLFKDEPPLLPNEFVEFTFDDDVYAWPDAKNLGEYTTFIGRFSRGRGQNGQLEDEWALRPLYYITPNDSKPKSGVVPLSPRKVGQAMYYEALLAPEITVVICFATYGTGKTFFAVNAGLNAVIDSNSNFERVFICPRDPSWGEQIGFLPGDEHQKTLANAMPIVDNIRSGIKIKGDKAKGGQKKSNKQLNEEVDKIIDDHCELTSMVHMGGRNLEDSWIIYDESQDFEWAQMHQLLSRIGEGSKIIVIGDPGQVHNKHMNANSCGISRAASKLAGGEHIAVISMNEDEIERSETAREIAQLTKKKYHFRKN
ncbi:PhoH family protein [Candidatus Saccharibacteria bacterium]|nr:PhoH family protein [Candidatus Saccharibacteria bacterium]